MTNLRICSIFLLVLCTFLFADIFGSPIHEKSFIAGGHSGRLARHRKREVADLPSKLSADDPQVKLYAQKGIEKLAETSSGPSEPILEKILEATFFPPAGKLLYEIKIKVGRNQNKGGSEECQVNVWRESDAEPSVTVQCDEIERKKRETDESQPQIADLPADLKIDDPEVTKYAQIAVDKLGSHSSGMKGIVREIVEAKSYPPSGKLLYTVKFKVGSTKCPKESNEKNCEYDPEAGDDNCEISVFKETDEDDSTSVSCWAVARRRRSADDGQPQIADLPSKLNVDDPQVKLYAQKGIEKLAETSSGPSEPILKKILEATFFPPAGKLLYEVKIKVGRKQNKDGSEECKVNVWRESDAEPSVTVQCDEIEKKKRETDETQPQIADLPADLKIDDPEVAKYAQIAVDKLGRHSSGMKGIVREIVEAKSYPPSGKLLYTVKFKVGSTKCPKESNEKNCEYDPEAGDDNCEISVFKETDEDDSTSVSCWAVARRRRSADDGQPQIADLPSKLNIDDPQVKLYAQKGIEKLAETSSGPSEPILEKILEATFFPPAGKLLYEVTIKVGRKQNKDGSEECKVNVWRESDAEPSVTVQCDEIERKKRETDEGQPQISDLTTNLRIGDAEIKKYAQKAARMGRRRRDATESEPQIADLPADLKIDDPEVTKYAQIAVDKLGGHSSGMKGIVREIVEAKSYPPSGKLLYTVKFKVGSTKCPKESNEKNCEYDPEAGDDNCEISVFKETDEDDSTSVSCWRVARRRRGADDGQPQIADLPSKSNVDDPQVKLYAQKGIKKLAENSTGPSDPVLEKILDATFFPSAGKLLYEINIKVGSNQSKDDTQECKVNVWRESDAEPSVTVECEDDLSVDDDDLPVELDIDDPEIKKYAQRGLEEYAKNSSGSEVVLVEIIAAYYVPVTIYFDVIKVKFGKSCSEDGKEDCKNDKLETEICALTVFDDSGDESVSIDCDEDEEDDIDHDNDDDNNDNDDSNDNGDDDEDEGEDNDLPVELDIDDPEIKKYAQRGLEEYAKNSLGSEVVLDEIISAFYIPITLHGDVVKVRFGKSACLNDEKEDCKNDKQETEICLLSILEDDEDETMIITCEDKKMK